MTRHVASCSAALAAWLLVTSAGPAAAQTTRPQTPRPPRDHGIELTVGGAWTGGNSFGSADANLQAPDGSSLTLFTSKSDLGAGGGPRVAPGFRVTKQLAAEFSGTWTHATIHTALSGDFENAEPLTATVGISRFTVEGSGVWTLEEPRPTCGGSCAAESAGCARSTRPRVLTEDGTIASVGGGMKYWWRDQARGTFRNARPACRGTCGDSDRRASALDQTIDARGPRACRRSRHRLLIRTDLMSLDSFKTRTHAHGRRATRSTTSACPRSKQAGFSGVARLPFSLKILLENLLRREDDAFVKAADIRALAGVGRRGAAARRKSRSCRRASCCRTSPACRASSTSRRCATASSRSAAIPSRSIRCSRSSSSSTTRCRSITSARPTRSQLNAELEYQRNRERYVFLRWGQTAFRNFRVVPPETGIVHQVNIEYLARVVCRDTADGRALAYPDTVFGTDSHTTMVNGLGVVGWGVGGIEAEAAMLGQPSSMLIPQVLGFRLTGRLPEGATATDLVLTITEALRKKGVVGKFVEFFGPGLAHLTIADRATLGNMCPEYGATVAIFPIDDMTLDYLRLTGRDDAQVALVEAYAKAQGLFRTDDDAGRGLHARRSSSISRRSSRASPGRGVRRIACRCERRRRRLPRRCPICRRASRRPPAAARRRRGGGARPSATQLEHGSVVIAAITSCTNTSNPSVMIGAGLVAKKAVERGLTRKPWVKTSLAPGSKVVTEYLAKAGLAAVPRSRSASTSSATAARPASATAVRCPTRSPPRCASAASSSARCCRGNRNFEGRIQQDVRANYLASPPLVVAYALAGSMNVDLDDRAARHRHATASRCT